MSDERDAGRPRPDVLAYPVATTGRFFLLVAALLNAGLLAGSVVHLFVEGNRWRLGAQDCWARAGAIDAELDRAAFVTSCIGPIQLVQTGYMLAAALLIALIAVVVLVLIPPVLRRRLRLRPAGPRLDAAAERIAELSAQARLRRPPRLFVGGAGQRDAFVFGLPGRYCVVLPVALAVRWRDESLFDPVVRHELAHLRRRDVLLAWLATAVWIAALPVLALPLVWSAVRWDFSLMPQYSWRVAAVMAVIWLLRRQALRSREHDADLEAAKRAGDHGPLSAVLRTAAGRQARGWRRLVSHHPTAAQRLDVLARPGKVPGVSIVDGAAAGFLTGLLLTLVFLTAYQMMSGTAPLVAAYTTALIVGPITGFVVGLGLWRQALIDRVTGRPTWPGGVALGVVGGLLLGHWTSFHGGGLAGPGVGGDVFGEGFTVPVIIVVGAAAVLLSAGTGRMWADVAARLPGGPKSWWLALVVNGLIFTAAVWAMVWLPMNFHAMRLTTLVPLGALDLGDLARISGRIVGHVVVIALVPFVLAVVAMVWRRRPGPIPAWLIDGPHTAESDGPRAVSPRLRTVVAGAVVAGLAATVGVAVHRAVNDDERLRISLIWLLTAAAVALVMSVLALVSIPRTGGAIGLITGIITALTAVAGMMAVNVLGFGDLFDLTLHVDTALSALTLWTLGYLWLLPLALAAGRDQ